MAEPLKHELLSAYLDDALSAAERDRVQRHLAANPEARQLVTELRVLRQSLQSLPEYKLPAEFRDRVLRQAERAMLTQPVDAPMASRASWPPKWLSAGGYRALAWPAAVLAVAIMLMVVYREQPAKMRNVAQVAKPPAEAGENRGERAVPELHSRAADERGSERVAPPRPKEDLLKGEGEGRSTAAKQPAGRPYESRRQAPSALAAAEDVQPKGKTAARAEGAAKRNSPAPRDGGQPTQPALDDASHAAARYAGSKAGRPATRRPLGDTADSLEAANLPADRPIDSQRSLERGILLVQVDVSRKAATAHAFEKLLERQRIVPQRHGALQQQIALPAQAKSTASDLPLARSRGGLDGTRAKKSAGRGPAPTQPAGQDVAGSASGGDVEVLYAEATESQIQAALEDLNQRVEEFPTLAVQPDPSQPRQTQFAMFRRGQEPKSPRRDLAYWQDQVRLNFSARPSEPVLSYGEFGRGARKPGPAGGVAEKGKFDQSGGTATAPPVAAGTKPARMGATAGRLAGVPKSEPPSRSAVDEKESLTENYGYLEQREATPESDSDNGENARQQAVAQSRGGSGFGGARQAGEQRQNAVDQPATSQLRTQQAPPPSTAPISARQLDLAQTTPGSSGLGRRSVAKEGALPLQIVFLLRVVGPDATPAVESKSSVAPEPAAAEPTTAPKPN